MDAKLTIVDVTGSTNDDLLEAGKQGAPHGTGLAARAQTAGRGRRGHKWDSTAGNLLLSIVLRPHVNAAKYSGLAAVSGLAVLEALGAQGLANEIGLKWPNDLVARGHKLSGRSDARQQGRALRRLRHWRQCKLHAPRGARWRLGGNWPLRPQRECSRRRCAAQGSLSRRYRRCRCLGRAPKRHGRKCRGARARPRRICRSPQLDWGARYRPLPRWRRTGARHLPNRR